MIRLTTLFPLCEDVHLMKDVGMIPYLLQKNHKYDCTIASFQNGLYPTLKSLEGLKLVFIAKFFRSATLNSLWYVTKNFRKIDVLQLYHLTSGSIVILSFFKALKVFSKGSVAYLKMDAGEEVKYLNYKGIRGRLFKFLISKIDLISTETRELHQFLNTKNSLGRDVSYIPNGFYPSTDIVPYDKKKNLILTVGRIGTEQKSNETLLRAFELFATKNKNWNVEFVGPVEAGFQLVIDKFFSHNPELLNRVTFTGAIYDRGILKSKYDEAKIFVLTSKWEGFPLVFLEAMKSGCTIVSTDLVAANDVTNNGVYGEKFKIDDYSELADILLKKVSDEEYLRSNTLNIQQYAKENFYWPDIVKQLNNLIEPKLVRN